MANKNTIKRHSSPGIYFSEEDMTVATKSMGITTLGVAGETLKGPAFQPIPISDWREFSTYFGGTSTEKYKGSQYPKYELPYIAKTYLEQSKQLEVVRVLGLSGVNAGPAWVITATKQVVFDGYVYSIVNGDPANEEYWNDEEHKDKRTLLNVKDMPQPPYITEEDEPYIRVVKEYRWHTLCSEKPGVEIPEERTYDTCEEFQAPTYEGEYARLAIEWNYDIEKLKYPESCISNEYVDAPIDFNPEEKFSTLTKHPKFIKKKCEESLKAKYWYYDTITPTEEGKQEYVEKTIEYVTKHYAEEPIEKVKVKTSVEGETEVFEYYIRKSDYEQAYDLYKRKGTEFYYYISIPTYDFYTKEYKYGVQTEDDDCGEHNNMAVAVLRSRGEHKRKTFVRAAQDGECNDVYEKDGILFYAKSVKLEPSKTLTLGDKCQPSYSTVTGDFVASSDNYGTFTIVVTTYEDIEKRYSVSLNPAQKNYIYKVIGSDPSMGDAEIYIEELYDVALQQLVNDGELNAINKEVVYYPAVYIVPAFEDVNDILSINENSLNKSYRGKRYIYSSSISKDINVRYSNDGGNTWSSLYNGINGMIYTVRSYTDKTTGKKEYFYGSFVNGIIFEYKKTTDPGTIQWIDCTQCVTEEVQNHFETKGDCKYFNAPGEEHPLYVKVGEIVYKKNVVNYYKSDISGKTTEILTNYNYEEDVVKKNYVFTNGVSVITDNMVYVAVDGDIYPITLDLNNYKEQYRYASTPWFLSEIKGSAEDIELHKLFRFHTISDGNASSTEIKVSIEDIDTEKGTFDVLIRDFFDSDYTPNVLERYNDCTLVPGTSNYIGLKIGTFDETYETISKYVTVEINEDDITMNSVPAGFLGYPIRDYSGFGLNNIESYFDKPTMPYLRYNTTIDTETRIKKQYFGMSDIVGIDTDMLSYKGVEAYNGIPDSITPCFHLDARILNGKPDEEGYIYDINDPEIKQKVTVDGINGYSWVTVNKNQITDMGEEPRIGDEEIMENTIYEDINVRKFTACFYGGFDGWDYYRVSRSNTDNFTYNEYKDSINSASGYGKNFSLIKDPEFLGFDQGEKLLNTDYYAYMAAYKQFENNKRITINVLATPGIDYVNQTMLVKDVIEMVEEDRGDCIYVTTTPDKPYGASDSEANMYSAQDVVYNLEDTGIDSNFTCTYYPWVKYYDNSNYQYIYLPITRDVVRSIAYTDNIAFSWYAAAGWNRGNISGVKPKRKLKLSEQDTLYDGRINFVNSFANDGDKIWGDKNLQIVDSQLNRLSCRRLLLRIRTMLSKACVGLLFDPNDASMSKSLYSAIDSVLKSVKENRGISAYKIEIDDSAERREKHELGARYYIKSNPLLEYIMLTATLTNQGVEL